MSTPKSRNCDSAYFSSGGIFCKSAVFGRDALDDGLAEEPCEVLMSYSEIIVCFMFFPLHNGPVIDQYLSHIRVRQPLSRGSGQKFWDFSGLKIKCRMLSCVISSLGKIVSFLFEFYLVRSFEVRNLFFQYDLLFCLLNLLLHSVRLNLKIQLLLF